MATLLEGPCVIPPMWLVQPNEVCVYKTSEFSIRITEIRIGLASDISQLRTFLLLFARFRPHVVFMCFFTVLVETTFICVNSNNKPLFTFTVAPCIMVSIYCSLTNKCTFY